MLNDVVFAEALDGYQLRPRFEHGLEGVVDVATLCPFEGVFRPLRDREQFVRVRVDPKLGTVCWPSGADLDPDVLYSIVTGESISTGTARS
jgi:Protein of unknown function (DUF2442)